MIQKSSYEEKFMLNCTNKHNLKRLTCECDTGSKECLLATRTILQTTGTVSLWIDAVGTRAGPTEKTKLSHVL